VLMVVPVWKFHPPSNVVLSAFVKILVFVTDSSRRTTNFVSVGQLSFRRRKKSTKKIFVNSLLRVSARGRDCHPDKLPTTEMTHVVHR
jgi:hypothetical protein